MMKYYKTFYANKSRKPFLIFTCELACLTTYQTKETFDYIVMN